MNFNRLSIRSLRSLPVPRKDRINVHKNARQTPIGRERIVRQVLSGQTPTVGAQPQASAHGWFASGLIDIDVKARQGRVIAVLDPTGFTGQSRKPVVEQVETLRRGCVPDNRSPPS
jgi:hypothetical protein